MKFKVREGFVVHHTKRVEIDLGDGEIKYETQTNTYYQKQPVEFTREEAEGHLHKLEPADKEARDYCESRYVPEAPAPVAAGGFDTAALAQLVAAAVAQALATQQQPAAVAS